MRSYFVAIQQDNSQVNLNLYSYALINLGHITVVPYLFAVWTVTDFIIYLALQMFDIVYFHVT